MTDSGISELTKAGIKAQRRAADPSISAWVSASAGSGKTRVLVDRTLRLMLAGTQPERILCITFTKAAAAEMANRLNEVLGSWSVLPEKDLIAAIKELRGKEPDAKEVVRARQLFASVLDAPGGIKIQTIHSFCSSVLARFPLEAGISPNFRELDDRTASEIMEVARDRLLSATRDPAKKSLADALRQVSERINEGDFAALMQALTSKRGRLRRFFKQHQSLNEARDALADILQVDPVLTEEELLEKACEEEAFDGQALRQVVEVLLNGTKTDTENANKLADWLSQPEKRKDLFDQYKSVFFTVKEDPKTDRFLAGAKSQKQMPEILDILYAERERLSLILETRKRIRVLLTTTAMLALAQRLLSEYEREKIRRGALDFDDLILTTRDLLKQTEITPWVMFKLDGGIDHILVDEAQDTSPEQWEVINALTSEFFSGMGSRDHARTVFVVGDEKQSIYSFQGADPAAFEHMRLLFKEKAERAQKVWEKVPMDLSFRSTHAVLSLVDDIFQSQEARSGLTVEASEIQHFVHRSDAPGFTEIWPVVKPQPVEDTDPWEIPLDQELGVSPPAQLAKNIATQIRYWLDNKEVLEAKGRYLEPKDIMILVQSRNALFDELVRALKQADIPLAGADRMQLTEQLAVMDLIALGNFVLLPEDDLTLAILLKSPFVGCDDNQLFELAYGRKGSLWSALQKYTGKIEIFKDAVGFLRRQMARADYVPVYEFYADILGREKGREKLVSRLGPEALDPIEEFLSLALSYQRSEATSLQKFLHWIKAGAAEIKRDMEQGRNEVRILTVHGSKGLQAPVVFLPDTCQGSAPPRNSQILWSEGGAHAPLWPVRKENYDQYSLSLLNQQKRSQSEEKKRLLYVALTRAEDRLYICGWENKKARPQGCWYDLIESAFRPMDSREIEEIQLPFGDVARRRRSGSQKVVISDEVKSQPDTLKALPEWARQMPAAEPFPPQPLTPSRQEEEPSVRSPLGGDDGHRFHRGIIIHRLLESLPSVPIEERRQTAKSWLARPAHGLSEEQQKTILKETLAVLDHPEFGDIFGPDSRAEVPITGLMDQVIMSGQIDRLLIRGDEVLIVDYKTNRPSPRDVSEVPRIYIQQMQIYYRALKKMYPGKYIRCALLWTDGPYLMELPESMM